jgi:hypothetical protein
MQTAPAVHPAPFSRPHRAAPDEPSRKATGIGPIFWGFNANSYESDLNRTRHSVDHFAGIDDVRQQMSRGSTGVRAGTNAMLQVRRGVGILRE